MIKITGLLRLLAAWAPVLLTASAVSAAGLFSAPGAGKSQEPTEILADRLVNHADEKYAEFTGDVKATQGGFSLVADQLRIYYEGDLLGQKESSKSTEITRIMASGKVHIVSDQYTADADRMEYDPATDVLTLTGDTAQVTSGRNSLSGSKITLNRRDGKALAESGPAARVKAFLQQDDQGKQGQKEAPPAGKPK